MINTKKGLRLHYLKFLYCFIVLLALGCGSKITYVNGDLPSFKGTNLALHHHALGLIELTKPVPIWQICRDGFARIDSQEIPFATFFATTLTRGIYTPTLTYVQCQDNSAYLIKIDNNGAVTQMAAVQPTYTSP